MLSAGAVGRKACFMYLIFIGTSVDSTPRWSDCAASLFTVQYFQHTPQTISYHRMLSRSSVHTHELQLRLLSPRPTLQSESPVLTPNSRFFILSSVAMRPQRVEAVHQMRCAGQLTSGIVVDHKIQLTHQRCWKTCVVSCGDAVIAVFAGH